MDTIYCFVDTHNSFYNLMDLHGQNPGLPDQAPAGTDLCFVDGKIYNLEESIFQSTDVKPEGPVDVRDVIYSCFKRETPSDLALLDGHYAFALWKQDKEVLTLGCDPIGAKRIYYSQTPKGLLCASDLNLLVKTSWFDRSISKDGLIEYFTYGYATPPFTLYQNVFVLMPGTYLLYENGQIEIKQYCDNIPKTWNYTSIEGLSEKDLIDHLELLLVDSVKRRLPKGNKIAAYLSGGLDTTLVCAILKKHSNKEITAVTLGSNDPGCDETSYAEETAKCLGIKNHFNYYITRDDFLETLFNLPDIYGQPFADSSAIPSTVIAREVAREYDDVFTGEGPDGLYGGVDFRLFYYYYKIVPYMLRIPVSIFADYMIRWFRKDLISPSLHIPELLRQRDFFWVFHKMFKSDELKRLLVTPINSDRFWGHRFLNSRMDIPLYERLRLAFLNTFITNDVLHKAIRAHNTNSVELICPYHDAKLYEFIQYLPSEYKFRNGTGKYLHKQLLARYVPKEILDRPKRGFRIDYSEFGTQTLRGLTDKYITPKSMSETGFINADYALKCVANYFKGDIRMGPLLWALLVFEIWRDKHAI